MRSTILLAAAATAFMLPLATVGAKPTRFSLQSLTGAIP
jgi:hypothetical protein